MRRRSRLRSRLRSRSRLRDRERLRLLPRSRSLSPNRPPRPPPPRLCPFDISTRTRFPQTLVPSRPLTASSASLVSSNSTKAKPGGFLATQTFFKGPYFPKQSSSSYLLALLPRLPMYTLQFMSQSRWRDIVVGFQCLKLLRYRSGRLRWMLKVCKLHEVIGDDEVGAPCRSRQSRGVRVVVRRRGVTRPR